jgi:hypothetical protein
VIEKSNLVCPWLPSTLVSDDGGRVMAFADCYGKQCPYWGVVDMVRGADSKSRSVWGCRRVNEALRDE